MLRLTLYDIRIDRGVTIHATADDVWPWLAQLGQDRVGFYSYDWLERAERLARAARGTQHQVAPFTRPQ